MANEEQLAILKQGVEAWNAWREANPEIYVNLSGADLRQANLQGVHLILANLEGADLTSARLVNAQLHQAALFRANLEGANLRRAELDGAILWNADLHRAHLYETSLKGADLRGANLRRAKLHRADLSGARLTDVDLYEADLREADLSYAVLVLTNLERADLTGCWVYGISAWDVKMVGAKQTNLIITHPFWPKITVDNLEVAQFIYLLIQNEKIRQVIDTITSKVVLILGRFTEERKAVLNAIRDELGKHDYIPVLFDFDKPASQDVTGMVETLARMARFIIADLTDPSSIPHELATVVPFLRTTPVLPLKLVGTGGYSMFADLQRAYPWVLKTYEYQDGPSLIAALPMVIAPADTLADELRSRS